MVIVQYPQPGIAEAYDRLKADDMLPEVDHVAYFIVASAPALLQAEVDGTPVMRTLRPAGPNGRQAEVLRVPYAVQTGGES
ncbi:hypothetical protein [Streptomyces europaeiscabiei]|uniref:hypothetical protein n=1 Tax=Streptomyces europaeiscabiei TaxID=146819 RepID=UPI002E19D70B